MDLELRKQAIFNSEGDLEGYEFLVSPSRAEEERRPAGTKLTTIAIKTLAEYGLKKVGEGKRVFLRVPIDTLSLNILDLLDPGMMVYRLLPPSSEVGQVIKQRIGENIADLRERGATFTAEPEVFETFEEIGEAIDALDIRAKEAERALSLAERLHKKILVWDVKNREVYELVRETCDYFQGDYLQPAVPVETLKIVPYLRSTLLRLLVMLNTARTPSEFSRVIGTDAGMTAKLLRFLNSAFFALRQPVSSVDQACIYFGLKNIKNFILVLSLNDYASVENLNLWKSSLVRARLMEELMKKAEPDRSGEAYLIGLLSNIEKMIGVEIASFLREVKADSYVIEAFTNPSSTQHRMLKTAIRIEEEAGRLLTLEEPERDPLLSDVFSQLGMPPEELVQHLRTAMRMAETIISH